MASKKRQAHNLFRSHDLTLIFAGILLQKKMDLAAGAFVFPFALSIVNITQVKSFENRSFMTCYDIT